MSSSSLICNLSVFLLLFLTDGDGLKIVNLNVPAGVPNTTTSSVILDCDYSLELDPAEGLVVKWLYNDHPNPVYQWIPPGNPQDAGHLKHRIDLTHKASDDPNEKFRAIKIINPTIDLTGVYTCFVSTFDTEARASKKMTIYIPAKSFEFSQSEDPEKGEIRLHCSAEGVYPEPEFNITTREKPNLFPVVTERSNSTDLYNFEGTVTFLRKDLTSKVTFDCVLSIPEADYTLTKTIAIPYGDSSSCGLLRATAFLILLLNLLAVRL